MKSFFALLESYFRFWPYAVAALVGAILAVVDDRAFRRRPVLAALLLLIAVAGFSGMQLSPFTFSGGDYYFESLIASAMALSALAGYATAALLMRIFGGNTA